MKDHDQSRHTNKMKGFMITDTDFFVSPKARLFGPRAGQIMVARATIVLCLISSVDRSFGWTKNQLSIGLSYPNPDFYAINDQPSQKSNMQYLEGRNTSHLYSKSLLAIFKRV